MPKEITYNHTFDSQKYFMLLMQAISRPGQVFELENNLELVPEGIFAATALIGMVLFDHNTSFAIRPQNTQAEYYWRENTGANSSILEEADYIVWRPQPDLSLLNLAKRGSLLFPDQSATLILEVESLSDTPSPGHHKITFSGPGVKDSQTFYCTSLSENLIELIMTLNEDYPAGLDIYLTDAKGNIVGWPRNIKIK